MRIIYQEVACFKDSGCHIAIHHMMRRTSDSCNACILLFQPREVAQKIQEDELKISLETNFMPVCYGGAYSHTHKRYAAAAPAFHNIPDGCELKFDKINPARAKK